MQYPHLLPRTHEFHYSSGMLQASDSVLGTGQVPNCRQRLPALQITQAPLPGPIYHGFYPCLAPKCLQATRAPDKTQARKAELLFISSVRLQSGTGSACSVNTVRVKTWSRRQTSKQELVRLALDGCWEEAGVFVHFENEDEYVDRQKCSKENDIGLCWRKRTLPPRQPWRGDSSTSGSL